MEYVHVEDKKEVQHVHITGKLIKQVQQKNNIGNYVLNVKKNET